MSFKNIMDDFYNTHFMHVMQQAVPWEFKITVYRNHEKIGGDIHVLKYAFLEGTILDIKQTYMIEDENIFFHAYDPTKEDTNVG